MDVTSLSAVTSGKGGEVGMDDLISRAAAIDAVYYKPNYKMAIEVLKEVPAVDAIPVEWLEGLMLSTDDDVDKVECAWIMREWQKEQEAR